MQRDCYRCRQPIEDEVAFCSACGAPQIRVSRPPEQPAEIPALAGGEITPEQLAAVTTPANLVGRSGIQWKSFVRTATPLAAFTGMLTAAVPPLGFFILLPVSLIIAMKIYRRTRPAPMRGGQGARMGAVMALLSFVFFTIFLLAFISLNPPNYQELAKKEIQQLPQWYPEQQAQQLQQQVSTTAGLIGYAIAQIFAALVLLLISGMGSGALIIVLTKQRTRPRL